MSNNYLFETREFGVSNTGIHLLRSGFNYQTIRWEEVNTLKITNGREVHNWFLVFLLGLAVFLPGAFISLTIIDTLSYEDVNKNYQLLVVLFIPFLGAHFIYNSLRTGVIMKMAYSQTKQEIFPLREIVSHNRLGEFKSYVKQMLN